jgi:hypothetical protein
MSLDANGATIAAPAQAPAATVQNPHPAAVQPAPAGVPNPITGQPAAPTINYHIAAPAPAAVPTTQQIAAPAPAPAPTAQQFVQIPMEQLQAFTSIQARLAEMESAQRSQQEAAQREQAGLLLKNGQLEDGLRMLREQSDAQIKTVQDQLGQTQRQAQNYAIDVEVARALAGHNFVNAKARRQFEAEVRAELTAAPEGHTFAVRTPTFQTAEQLVAAKIATNEYNFMLAPTGVGGTATGQTTQAAHTPPANIPIPAAPDNFNDWFIGAAASGKLGTVHVPTDAARIDLSRPMGLRAAR